MSLAKYLAKLHLDMAPNAMAGKRAKAVRAVRDVVRDLKLKNDSGTSYFDHGWAMYAHRSPDNGMIVKFPHGEHAKMQDPRQETFRRLHMKDLLHQSGDAPETFMVQTGRLPYLVEHEGVRDITRAEADAMRKKLEAREWLPADMHSSNMARGPNGEPWVIDSGEFAYPNPHSSKWGESPVQTETDRARARSRRITRKGDR